MTEMTWRRDALFTDDPEEAFTELQKRKATGERGWDMAEVRQMPDPPKTTSRYAVFQTTHRFGVGDDGA